MSLSKMCFKFITLLEMNLEVNVSVKQRPKWARYRFKINPDFCMLVLYKLEVELK